MTIHTHHETTHPSEAQGVMVNPAASSSSAAGAACSPSPENRMLFSPGQVVTTPGALEAMAVNQCLPLNLLHKHLTGDWGEVPPEDADANREALQDGSRILSSYPLENGARIWIITEADRSVTTLLLPEEY